MGGEGGDPQPADNERRNKRPRVALGEGDPQPADDEWRDKRPQVALGEEERVADVIIYNTKKQIVQTVFEVKSAKGKGVTQNMEQMAGLLRINQSAILGVVVEPSTIHINLFLVNHQEKVIYHHQLKGISMETNVGDGLVKLEMLIIFTTW